MIFLVIAVCFLFSQEAYRKYLLCCYKVFLMLSTEVNSEFA